MRFHPYPFPYPVQGTTQRGKWQSKWAYHLFKGPLGQLGGVPVQSRLADLGTVRSLLIPSGRNSVAEEDPQPVAAAVPPSETDRSNGKYCEW